MHLLKRSMKRELIAFLQIGAIEEERNVLDLNVFKVTPFSAFESRLVHYPPHSPNLSVCL